MDKKYLKGFVTGLFMAFILSSFVIWLMIRDRKLNVPYGRNAMTERLDTLQTFIDDFYLFDDEYEEEDLYTGAYKGYVEALGDKYSAYYPPSSLDEIKENRNEEIVGIGVYMVSDTESGRPKIFRVIPNSAAAKAGIEVGDIIISIDGTDTEGMTADKAGELVKGYGATEFNMKVRRGSEENEYTLKRRAGDKIYTEQKLLDNSVGYVKITEFGASTEYQFEKSVEDMISLGAESFIFDLRGNKGGETSVAKGICDYFLPSGKLICYTIDKKGRREEYVTSEDDTFDKPFVILMDGESASSSEIVIGCLKEYMDAKTFGSTSFGKGISQNVYLLEGGGSIKLTSAYWYTPDGVCIHKQGFTPDFPVEDDPDTENDEVIDEAIKYLSAK